MVLSADTEGTRHRSGICATPKLCETNQRSALPTRPEARAIVGISTHAKDLTSASREYSPLMPNKFPDGYNGASEAKKPRLRAVRRVYCDSGTRDPPRAEELSPIENMVNNPSHKR